MPYSWTVCAAVALARPEQRRARRDARARVKSKAQRAARRRSRS